MYRDDACAVCGEALPPDHFYCRAHSLEVEDRLHRIGALLPSALRDMAQLASLMGEVAEETWDYLADLEPDDPSWPPVPRVEVRADADAVSVDVASEPGMVRLTVDLDLRDLLRAVVAGLEGPALHTFASACAQATGMNATH